MGFTLRAASVAQLGDGTFGFYQGGYDYLLGGWVSTSPFTNNKFWRSGNNGVTFDAMPDFAYPLHTPMACVVDEVAYLVGGDTINFTFGGAYIRSSWKCENGVWSQIAADPGIENRCIGCLVHMNGAFYLIGGSSSTDKAAATHYRTVLRSDDGLQTFTTILADTRTQGFDTPLAHGSYCVHRNKIWRIGTGGYHGIFYLNEPETSILSSSDGITWEYRGRFKGLGRTYPQVLSHNGKIYVFNGNNPGAYESTADVLSSSDGDMRDWWTIEELNGGRLVQTYRGQTGWDHRHAAAMWSSPNGIKCFCGSVATPDLWTLEE